MIHPASRFSLSTNSTSSIFASVKNALPLFPPAPFRRMSTLPYNETDFSSACFTESSFKRSTLTDETRVGSPQACARTLTFSSSPSCRMSQSMTFAPAFAKALPIMLHKTPPRSEEHTSELQSLTNLVCRLLLEKNKYRTRPARLARDEVGHLIGLGVKEIL